MKIDNNLKEYLSCSELIDFNAKSVNDLAISFNKNTVDKATIAGRIFYCIRDAVPHSNDIKTDIVTVKASDVLVHKTGICYSKSHLTAALLRACGIPAGFVYQILKKEDKAKPTVVHALNAFYYDRTGKWYLIDPRKNSKICTEFDIDNENKRLAYPKGHSRYLKIIPEIFSSPNKKTVAALKKAKNLSELMSELPPGL